MPRFYFHLYNDVTAEDHEGVELSDQQEARIRAVEAARDIISGQVKQGRLDLDDRIEVVDHEGQLLFTIHFRDAVEIRSERSKPVE